MIHHHGCKEPGDGNRLHRQIQENSIDHVISILSPLPALDVICNSGIINRILPNVRSPTAWGLNRGYSTEIPLDGWSEGCEVERPNTQKDTLVADSRLNFDFAME